MSELIVTERENIVAIADAIRNKTGTTEAMSLGGIVDSINGIETGGGGNTTMELFNVTVSIESSGPPLGSYHNVLYYGLNGDGTVTAQFIVLDIPGMSSKSVSFQCCKGYHVFMLNVNTSSKLSGASMVLENATLFAGAGALEMGDAGLMFDITADFATIELISY